MGHHDRIPLKTAPVHMHAIGSTDTHRTAWRQNGYMLTFDPIGRGGITEPWLKLRQQKFLSLGVMFTVVPIIWKLMTGRLNRRVQKAYLSPAKAFKSTVHPTQLLNWWWQCKHRLTVPFPEIASQQLPYRVIVSLMTRAKQSKCT